MKLIALTGLHGAGKDTVADALPARKLAFADTLYAEVAEAFDVEVSDLKCRATKERPTPRLSLINCDSSADGFIEHAWDRARDPSGLNANSPRQILQWWGDYRRAQDPEYFVAQTVAGISNCTGDVVITDARQANEAAMVRALGGQIWQVVRPGHEPPRTGHHTETDGSEFAPDVVLVNSWGIAELQAAALEEWTK